MKVKLKIGYGDIKIEEEMGSLENSHLVAPIVLYCQCAEREGILFE